MITIDEMLAIIAIGDGVFIKVAPEDWVRRFSKPITREKLIEQYPAKYRNDLAGFVVVGECSYRPCFATMQSEWDAELSGYIARKAEWSPLPMIVNQNEDFYVDGDFDYYLNKGD